MIVVYIARALDYNKKVNSEEICANECSWQKIYVGTSIKSYSY